jgi:ABC-2 type transport system ATP-binding protein
MSILETNDLTKFYGKDQGLEGLSVCIEEGSTVGFLGPNGSGKTTTIRLLLGLLRPTRGSARIFDLDCWRASSRIREDVGYLPGDLRLYPWLTGRLALRLFGKIRRRDLTRAGHELLDDLGLDPLVKVSKMSRGMRQKLGLVLALAHEPRFCILDEPTTGLDPIVQERLRLRLEALEVRGHTILFSTHTLSEVDRLCRRVIVLREGRLVADAPLETLRRSALRDVEIVWGDPARAAEAEPPPSLRILGRNGRVWRCRLEGSTVPLIAWLAREAVDDVTIGPPDVDAIFRGYYERLP